MRSGAGLAYWFNPLAAAVAQVPVEDIETTFVSREQLVMPPGDRLLSEATKLPA